MTTIFLSHAYKKLTRSSAFSKDLAKGIFMGFLAVMIIGYSLGLGFAMDGLITGYLKQPDSLLFVNKLLLYYFVMEFVMRYFMQNVPALDVQPYLHLPIHRSSIAHYLLTKSLVHVFNSSVFLLFAPFTFKVVAPQWGIGPAIAWLGCLVLLSIALHYLVIFYKKRLDDSIWGIVLFVGVFGLLGASDYYGWFQLSDISRAIFHQSNIIYATLVVSFGLVLIFYWLDYQVLISSMYADDWSSEKDSATEWGKYSDWQFLQGFGTYGEWINLEIKLILRNKRPRTFVMISALLLLYGLIFYKDGGAGQKMPGVALFAGMFITGAFMINYGQLLFSWQGSHFDFTLTRPLSIRQFIESKYWMLSATTLVAFVVSLPYAYFGWRIVFTHLAMMLFNMGVNIFIIMNLAMWGPQKIDLKKGSTFNYEGMGAAQWVMAIPLMLAPFIFYLPFKFIFSTNIGILAVALAGLTGIACRPFLINLTAKRLEQKKYEIAAGFRKE